MNVLIDSETLTAIARSIRKKTGKTNLLFPSDMASEIENISNSQNVLPELSNPASTSEIALNYQAIDQDGNIIDGMLDTESIRQKGYEAGYRDGTTSVSDRYNEGYMDGVASVDIESIRREGYNEGYNVGYEEGSGGVKPLTYAWDENTLTLTITEV